jgi:hypothetical protein
MLLGADAEAQYPHFKCWSAEIADRPAVQRAFKTLDKVRMKLTPFDKAQPDMMDKIFGRGQHAAA